MKAVWTACRAAGITAPDKVQFFFADSSPEDNGAVIEIKSRKWSDDDLSSGLEVDLSDLPAHVKTIRFINSW